MGAGFKSISAVLSAGIVFVTAWQSQQLRTQNLLSGTAVLRSLIGTAT